jgi:hypothetical protein
MRSERGQATVEWIGIVLLVTVALTALARLAPRADDRGLATSLAHAVTHPDPAATDPDPAATPAERGVTRPARAFTAPPLVPRPLVPHPGGAGMPDPGGAGMPGPGERTLLRWVRRAGGPLAGRVRRGAGLAWRRAWFACLVYERARWAFLHPESRFPGYTMPPSEVLRIANDCISPVDAVRDWPLLGGQ